MNPTGKKFISLFLVFSLMMLSANLYAKERRGAKLIITKKDRLLIVGELITVKSNSLLLLDTVGKDVSVDIADIKVIKIVKKSKVESGVVWGGVFGALSGIGFALLVDASGEEGWGGVEFSEYLLLGAGGLVAGVLYGGLIGAIFSVGGKKIRIEGMTDLEIRETMDKLRKKARIRDYR
jgi:hypothetical protein